MKLSRLLPIITIILFVVLAVKSNSIVKFEEEYSPHVNTILTYDDNTIVVQIIRANSQNCLDRNLSFRTLYPNGTSIPINLSKDKLGIQPLNFCFVCCSPLNGDLLNPITIYAIKSNYLLMIYTVVEDMDNSLVYNEWGMIIDLSGNIYRFEKKIKFLLKKLKRIIYLLFFYNDSKTLLGPSYVDPNTNKWVPGLSKIVPNVDNGRGFIYVATRPSSMDAIENFSLQQLIM
jgi:hypothetical protein